MDGARVAAKSLEIELMRIIFSLLMTDFQNKLL
jgi:hypothetical protein